MKEFGLEPYTDRLIVRKVEIEQKTASGIILATPEPVQEIYYGVVMAVGEGKRLEAESVIPMKTEVGDTVAFNPRVGTPIKHEGQDYILIRESEIFYRIKQ